MAEETPALSAHDTAMVAKVDAAGAALAAPVATPEPATASPAVRPEHIPEKFWDSAKGEAKVDEMAKSYAELEKARVAAEPPVVPPAPAAPAAADFAAFTSEFETNGKLADTSYEALAKAGIPKAIVDEFIASKAQGARVAEYESKEAVAEAHAHAGSEAAFSNMLTWAAANLPQAEQAAFDEAVTGSPAARKQAVLALRSQYKLANGSEPALISGEGAGMGAGAYQSRAEVTAAMRDPRYKADPAYRAAVERRIDGMASF